MHILAQSSIEFLTTYSFLFIMLGILASIIFFFATVPNATIPLSCSAFSGPACDVVEYYMNASAGYSMFIVALTNSESIPINITGITVQIRSSIFTGSCAPSLVYPGGDTVCIAGNTTITNFGTLMQGFYYINATPCNSGLNNIQSSCAASSSISYSGSFTTTQALRKPLAFSVIAAAGPEGSAIAPYSALPALPKSWSVVQNGYWITSPTGYAYGAQQYNGNYLGFSLTSFPQTTSSLNGNALCTAPYNSMLTIAYGIVYSPKTSLTPKISLDTSGAMEAYYEEPGSSSWISVFSGSAWKLQPPTIYSNTITLNTGLSKIAVEWSSNCIGMQVLNITGLPR